jgi:hypothetical protein
MLMTMFINLLMMKCSAKIITMPIQEEIWEEEGII